MFGIQFATINIENLEVLGYEVGLCDINLQVIYCICDRIDVLDGARTPLWLSQSEVNESRGRVAGGSPALLIYRCGTGTGIFGCVVLSLFCARGEDI